jgi:hypothetical protein
VTIEASEQPPSLIDDLFAGVESARPDLMRADAVLSLGGVRLMTLPDGSHAIGIWSDLDSAELRQAIRAYGWDQAPVRYLDGDGIPSRYRLRTVAGEVVPVTVLKAMQAESAKPWLVRDRMLAEMGWRRGQHEIGRRAPGK